MWISPPLPRKICFHINIILLLLHTHTHTYTHCCSDKTGASWKIPWWLTLPPCSPTVQWYTPSRNIWTSVWEANWTEKRARLSNLSDVIQLASDRPRLWVLNEQNPEPVIMGAHGVQSVCQGPWPQTAWLGEPEVITISRRHPPPLPHWPGLPLASTASKITPYNLGFPLPPKHKLQERENATPDGVYHGSVWMWGRTSLKGW